MFLKNRAQIDALIFALLLPVLASWGHSQQVPRADLASQVRALHLPASANELARETIQNELRATEGSERFEYRGRRQTPKGSQTKEYVETNDGIVARLIAVNDSPLSRQDTKKEQKRLHKLLTDPGMQAKRYKQQQEDAERVRKMLRSMPDAFTYSYEDLEQSENGPTVKLVFFPNPSFDPPNRETEIYRGMNGYMMINAGERRLVEIAATLFQEVNFGWGILGRLNPGGHFIVKQSRIGPGRWETTEQSLRFTGKVFFFKSLNIDEDETESDFRKAPSKLSLEQGIEFLERQNPEVAEGSSSQRQSQ